MAGDLDAADRRLLDHVQAGLPLVRRPFAAAAAALGTTEGAVIERLRALAARGVLRQIGAIFDTRACGYASALVAARVPAAGLDAAAAAVAGHPGVTHCYERAHAWNLWFTLAVPPTSALGLAGTVRALGEAAGVGALRVLPALRTFKIAARFALDPEGAPWPAGGARNGPTPGREGAAGLLAPEAIRAVQALQRPLPLVAEPFAAVARAAGLDETDLLEQARRLLAGGVMRRFAALLHHRRAGFGANVMAVWALPAPRIAAAAARIVGLGAVSHCYERPTFPDWPYALFTMLHGRTRAACLDAVRTIREAIAPDAVALLWTLREFKKTRLLLFTPEYEAWEAALAAVTP